MKVMIVDDEELIRRGLEKILGKMGLGIDVIGSFGNGMEAWNFLSRLDESELDVLITDIKMPMMDGLKLAEKMQGKSTSLIVLSGFGEFEYARRALRSGVTDYLLKPVDKGALYETLLRIKTMRHGTSPEVAGILHLGCLPDNEGEHADSTAGKPTSPDIPAEKMHPVVQQIRSVLEREFDKNLDMEAFAEMADMSANYLSRLFKQETGATITDYLIDVRIAKAKQFLQDHPHLKNYEIAQLVGYNDPVYFNKLFKKNVGITPREFRTEGGS